MIEPNRNGAFDQRRGLGEIVPMPVGLDNGKSPECNSYSALLHQKAAKEESRDGTVWAQETNSRNEIGQERCPSPVSRGRNITHI